MRHATEKHDAGSIASIGSASRFDSDLHPGRGIQSNELRVSGELWVRVNMNKLEPMRRQIG
jgi:hypothetical protein